ncbi:1-deoxy-D-xylulose 5-phosphate reductoisomerase [Beijerinckiaceae bacterium RH AL1]|nr:1-deoxy-D-xylulose-5-phosphate reductoisomerase [Beijerinckiaceae bacterium]VVB44641.1 1-deoxy-D-xylulose 5-phosphate reductoisomerase [Beijerinckiaceae bacterium RH CH11]VVB44719.1 1-deoxy-D-xylulose 5-phosphate reductoisomerase [Beijerinckiaceae bacterium RH AL8]VVC54461.1 1-deoxy-D-xylulose 5-phosphate reductoisomerase [Beijerinckiaceae bacterium RH AL1]
MDQIVGSRDNHAATRQPRVITVLGATGSIGRSTEEILLGAPDDFSVAAVAGGRDAQALAKTAIRLKASFAALADPDGYAELKDALAGTGITAAAGDEAVIEAALHPSDLVIGAIAGAAGVRPTFAALEAGRTIALANKECLVCAGPAFMRQAESSGTRLLPVDSEHNAIFQALGDADLASIEMMTLTASGGPFRSWTREQIAEATPEQALAHPNWAMGPKVTIDCAGLMNKGLEVIEAHHIFGIEAARLDVLVHAQSIVHGLVSFTDGSVTAGLASPDMKVPIGHCLGYPDRLRTKARRLDLATIGTLTFERPDLERFPALRVALDSLRAGQGMPTVMNAANEIAVEAFLKKLISFHDIARLVEEACEAASRDGTAGELVTIEDALGVDHVVRERTRSALQRLDVG